MIVELANIKFFAYHGLYDFERENGGDFIIDVLVDMPDLAEYTALEHVADYEIIYAITHEEMETAQLFIEEVANNIKLRLVDKFNTANAIKVSVTKCAPPITGMSGFAKVTAVYKK